MNEERQKNPELQPEEQKEEAQPTTEEKSDTTPEEARASGPIIGTIIIILVLIIGAFYFWTQNQRQIDESLEAIVSEEAAAQSIGALETQGASDEIGSIEEDLVDTSLENLDAELDAIESELQF